MDIEVYNPQRPIILREAIQLYEEIICKDGSPLSPKRYNQFFIASGEYWRVHGMAVRMNDGRIDKEPKIYPCRNRERMGTGDFDDQVAYVPEWDVINSQPVTLCNMIRGRKSILCQSDDVYICIYYASPEYNSAKKREEPFNEMNLETTLGIVEALPRKHKIKLQASYQERKKIKPIFEKILGFTP
jgi:hypothetical protein